MIIHPLEDTANVHGLSCKRCFATFPAGKHDTINILYTESFHIKEPNRTNPYKDVNGVLVQFNVPISKLEMQFKAKTVKYQEVPSDEFEVPEDYRAIPRDKMILYIKELLDK